MHLRDFAISERLTDTHGIVTSRRFRADYQQIGWPMRIFTALILLGLVSGCAMDDFFVDDYDDDFLDSEMTVYEGTSPGYRNFIPGSQPSQVPQSPPVSGQPVSQTKEPPM